MTRTGRGVSHGEEERRALSPGFKADTVRIFKAGDRATMLIIEEGDAHCAGDVEQPCPRLVHGRLDAGQAVDGTDQGREGVVVRVAEDVLRDPRHPRLFKPRCARSSGGTFASIGAKSRGSSFSFTSTTKYSCLA